MQIQLDPAIPAQVPPEQLRDFKSFLDTVLEGIIGPAANPLLETGNLLWTGLAAIVVVLTGAKIAYSGNIQPWDIVRLVIGLWVPWVMLQFYSTPIPGLVFTFPGVITAGGNWLHNFLLADTAWSMHSELGNLVTNLAEDLQVQANQGSILGVLTGGAHAVLTLVSGAVIMLFVVTCLVVLFAVTYAQVIWAQIALAILTLLGPIFIPWLVFEPMSFMFWGWFRAMLTYSLYAVIAGAVMRVFSGVGLAYVTTLGTAQLNWQSIGDLGLWLLAVLPLFVAGILSSLKCGELASMLVTGAGASGSGLMGMAGMAGTVATGASVRAAAKAGAGGLK